MASVPEKELQKLYGSFAGGMTDEEMEKIVGDSERIMRAPAGWLLTQAGLDKSTSKPFALLDNACGTGPIVAHLQDEIDKKVLSESRIVCSDFNGNLVDVLKRRSAKYGWINVETAVGDAQKSEFPDQSFSHVTINFAMHIIPKPEAVVEDTIRMLKPGGVFGFTVWHKDNEGWAPDMRSCFDALPFDAPMPNTIPMAIHGKLQWTDPEGIEKELKAAGFEDIQVKTVPHIVRVHSAEDYLQSYRMMKDWMINTHWNEETKAKAKDMLDDHIVKHLKEKHNGEGWDLHWTLILATGKKPSS